MEDYFTALAGGPWFLFNHYLLVQRWFPDFKPSAETYRKIAVWLQLPELPIEYYDRDVLFKIGALIGTPIKIDANTGSTTRGRYARICVEIQGSSRFPRKFKLVALLRVFTMKCTLHFACHAGLLVMRQFLVLLGKEPEEQKDRWITVSRKTSKGRKHPDPQPVHNKSGDDNNIALQITKDSPIIANLAQQIRPKSNTDNNPNTQTLSASSSDDPTNQNQSPKISSFPEMGKSTKQLVSSLSTSSSMVFPDTNQHMSTTSQLISPRTSPKSLHQRPSSPVIPSSPREFLNSEQILTINKSLPPSTSTPSSSLCILTISPASEHESPPSEQPELSPLTRDEPTPSSPTTSSDTTPQDQHNNTSTSTTRPTDDSRPTEPTFDDSPPGFEQPFRFSATKPAANQHPRSVYSRKSKSTTGTNSPIASTSRTRTSKRSLKQPNANSKSGGISIPIQSLSATHVCKPNNRSPGCFKRRGHSRCDEPGEKLHVYAKDVYSGKPQLTAHSNITAPRFISAHVHPPAPDPPIQLTAVYQHAQPQDHQQHSTVKIPHPLLLSWTPPPPDFIKLNVDGSCLGNPGFAGCGGVLRTPSGCLVAVFYVYLGITSNDIAEMQGIKYGLQLATSLQIPNLIVESDSLSSIQMFNRRRPLHPRLELLHHECSAAAAGFNRLSYLFAYRECNHVATKPNLPQTLVFNAAAASAYRKSRHRAGAPAYPQRTPKRADLVVGVLVGGRCPVCRVVCSPATGLPLFVVFALGCLAIYCFCWFPPLSWNLLRPLESLYACR
ncbi:hypothetical protein CCACVL1_29304 [Corchorus capsularis]|uniref:RNase H type-1 domain-containing protein n=1 Tax=Corchorus capsularis TaxID=210143 RepID=A0A1R3G2C3_COCAP|nr:hypothetical protein CCACVL1_29304 [Corchorus capsularis]